MAMPDVEEQAIPTPGTYEVEPAASTIRFETRSVFGLLPVRGTFTIGHGRIHVSEDVAESSVDVVIEAAGFDSGIRQRDDHVRSADYLDAAAHPEISFSSRRVERSATGDTLPGELTVRGVTTPTALTVDAVLAEEQRFTARGTATIDRYAFGLTKAKGMTGRYLRIILDVSAKR